MIRKILDENPSMILVDLNAEALEPIEAICALKADSMLQTIPIVSFYSHVQNELREKALQAGCDTVLPRSVFAKNLADVLNNRFH